MAALSGEIARWLHPKLAPLAAEVCTAVDKSCLQVPSRISSYRVVNEVIIYTDRRLMICRIKYVKDVAVVVFRPVSFSVIAQILKSWHFPGLPVASRQRYLFVASFSLDLDS